MPQSPLLADGQATAPSRRPAPAPDPRGRLLGDILIEMGALTPAALARALALQRHEDVALGEILSAHGLVARADLEEALSRQSGLGRIDLDRRPVDPGCLGDTDPARCLALDAVPWRRVGSTLIVALADPAKARTVVAAFARPGLRVVLGLADRRAIHREIALAFRTVLRERARTLCPAEFSCRAWAGRLRRGVLLAVLAAVLAAVLVAPLTALQLLIGWIVFWSTATSLLRLAALLARLKGDRRAMPAETIRLADYKRLPRVSVLVPLLREDAVAAKLVDRLQQTTYPRELLDLKLVLEEDDQITRDALRGVTLPDWIEVLPVPRDTLRTKPRAMNYALPFCRGEIVGIYDAEDRPHPDQIHEVVHTLMHAPPEVACVQGYLDFYNERQNWLARCFTLEYAIWFRVLLHGMQRLGVPIPLGGTTVFFRRNMLERLGAWDAHNVTEDADLGMRLARFGFRCAVIASVTEEEANCHARAWIRQRARWLKGYVMTWATHMRRPAALWRDLGPVGFIGFQTLFLGAITAYLALPLFWAIWIGAFGFDLSFWQTLPWPLMVAFFTVMLLGQVLMVVIAVMAVRARGRRHLLPWIATLPFYWPLGAVAAYRAVAEVFTRPFHWHKTAHGIAP